MIVSLVAVATKAGTVDRATAQRSVTTTIASAETVTVSLAAGSTAVQEGTPATFTVTLSGTTANAVTVPYETTPSPSADYKPVTNAMLTIAAGVTTGAITVDTVEDDFAEATDTFTVTLTLSDPPADNIALGTETATQTIRDDDPLTVSVTTRDTTVLEGGTATFTVTLAGGRGSANIDVKYIVSGTAEPRTDYPDADLVCDPITSTCSGTLTMPANQTTGTDKTATIAIPIVQEADVDAALEGPETLTVTLAEVNTTAGTVELGTPREATTTIGASDRTVNVSVAVDDADTGTQDVDPVAEGDAATFTVSLTGKVSEDLVVGYATAHGTATATDYQAQTRGTLTISLVAEQQEGKITINTLQDTLAEEDGNVQCDAVSAGPAGQRRTEDEDGSCADRRRRRSTSEFGGPGQRDRRASGRRTRSGCGIAMERRSARAARMW